MVVPMAAGLSAMRTPAARSASIFASAPPRPPATIAPACPIRRPAGAVRPAMNPTTGFAPNGFTDTPNWVDQAVDWATHHGLMTGYDNNTFRPDNDITRGAVARLDERLGLSPWAWNDPTTAPNTLPFRPD